MELNIGQVISNTFGMVKERFGGLLGVWLIYFAIQLVLMFILFAAVGSQFALIGAGGFESFDNPLAMGGFFVLLMIVFYFAYFLLYFASQISMAHHASPLLSPDLGSSFMAGIRSLLTAVGLVLIFIVGYFVFAILMGIIIAVLSFAGETGGIIGAVIAMISLIYLACRLILTMPIVAVEGERNPISAITRSWALTSGNALRIFLTLLLFGIVMMALGFLFVALLGGSMGAVFAGAGAGADPESLGMLTGGIIFSLLLFVVIGAVVAMIMASFISALHAALSPTASITATFE